jgi:outer membrane lipoprotein-sorting protein
VRICLFALCALVLLVTSAACVFGNDGRPIIDHLYITKGQMPIEDMIIELDESVATSSSGQGSGSLVAAGKDKIYFKAPNKIRIDSIISDPGGALDRRASIIIRDGTSVLNYLSTGQYPVKKKQDEPSAPLNIPFNIVHYQQDVERVYTVTGTEMIDDVNTTVVKITNNPNPSEEITVWVDRTRNVPLQLTLKKKGDKGEDILKKVLYRDIRKTKDDRFFPFKLEIYVNDKIRFVVAYTALAINCGVDPTLFTPMEKFIK